MRVGPARRGRVHQRVTPRVRQFLQLVLFVSTWSACAPATAQSQGVPANVPGTLLRRLADAADAFRTGNPIWIVADPNLPHDISGVYNTLAEADADPSLGTGYTRYGPFVTPPDSGVVRQAFAVCMHTRRPYSQWMCPPAGGRLALDSVISIQFTVNAVGREPMQLSISPDSVDVLFFTLSAFDKYLLPYYTSAYGPRYSATLRDSIAAAIRREND